MKPIVDLSHHQKPKDINYDLLADSVSGVMIRAAYGSRNDDHVETHYKEFKKRNVPIGFYHYVTQFMSVQSQVDKLASVLKGKEYPMGLWADIEREAGADPLLKQQVHDYIQRTEAQVEYITGIYTSKYYWGLIMNGAYYTNKKLWVAAYGYAKPPLPTGWNDYWLWQYTSSGKLPGYSGSLDISNFRYDEETYHKWVTGVSLPEEPEPSPPLTKLYRPCDKWAYITQLFGVNQSIYPTSKGHNGIDFGFSYQTGHPIYAAADGVVEVSREETSGYGRHIRIRHSHGVTIYGHLSKRLVEVGDKVVAKQVIGLNGGNPSDPYAGFSTGPHLHFEYRWDIPAPQVPGGYVYNAVDPLPLIIEHEEDNEEGDNGNQEGDEMLFQVKVIVSQGLNIRDGVGTGAKKLYAVTVGTVLDVFEILNGWYRVGVGKWCSGDPNYTERLGAVLPPEEYTLEQKVDKLWEVHPELH